MNDSLLAKRRKTKSIKWTLRISPEIKAMMITQSEKKGQTLSEYIRNLVEIDSLEK